MLCGNDDEGCKIAELIMVIPVLIVLPGAALMGNGSRQSNLQGREKSAGALWESGSLGSWANHDPEESKTEERSLAALQDSPSHSLLQASPSNQQISTWTSVQEIPVDYLFHNSHLHQSFVMTGGPTNSSLSGLLGKGAKHKANGTHWESRSPFFLHSIGSQTPLECPGLALPRDE